MVQGYGLSVGGPVGDSIWAQKNGAARVSVHFTVHDAVYLPTWDRLAVVQDGLTDKIKVTLMDFFRGRIEPVRDFLTAALRDKYKLAADWEAKIDVHCCYRPPSYNALESIGGAPSSAHLCLGPWAALDFHVVDFEGGPGCDKVREVLAPKLPDLKVRMEKRPGSDWVHVDSKPLPPKSTNWYFIP